jgi:hypothetical protein
MRTIQFITQIIAIVKTNKHCRGMVVIKSLIMRDAQIQMRVLLDNPHSLTEFMQIKDQLLSNKNILKSQGSESSSHETEMILVKSSI